MPGCDVIGVDTIPKEDKIYSTDYATVLAVQKALLARGYKLPKYGADGKMGEETATAIKQFQASLGYDQTGVIDYGVILKLGIPTPSSATSSSTFASRPTGPSSPSAPGSALVPSAPGATAPSPNFFQKEAFGGLKVWQVMLGALGSAAVIGGTVYLIAGRSRRYVVR